VAVDLFTKGSQYIIRWPTMSKESTGYSILAVDTSSPLASWAIVRGDRVLATLAGDTHLPHSQSFFSNLPTLLQLAGIKIREIDAFAAATGPGSFTGLRVGLAAVKGLAGTLSRPSVGISSFDALALGTGASGLILVMIDAGREEVYCGLREVSTDGAINVIGEDLVGKPSSLLPRSTAGLKSLVITGSGAVKFKGDIEIAARNARADLIEVRQVSFATQSWQLKAGYIETGVNIAKYAARLLHAGVQPGIHPYYIRPSDAEIKLVGPA
jgi:tRNA threonylcarbamoyladenosine biosynthesis protein TsaB